MSLFPKREKISPDFIAAPTEPQIRTGRRHELIQLIDEELKAAQQALDPVAIDELLAARSAVMRLVRAAAPVIPGRSS